MIKLDLHIHSQYSEDGAGTPEEIIASVKKKGLQGIAITDHNTIAGAIKALKLASKDFIVIPGIEISTSEGHILALNVKNSIPRGLTIEETVEEIIDMGGTPVVPHLYRNLTGVKIVKLKKIYKKVSAIEVFNACSIPKANQKTAKVAKIYNLGGIGGSDSHDPEYAGYAYTTVNTTNLTIDSVISEINKKKTWGEGTTIPLNYRSNRMFKSINQFFQRGFKRI